MTKAILTSVLCVGMASAAYAGDKGFSLPVPPGIPHQLVPGAKGSWLPLPPAPPLASWDSVRVPGGRVPVLVPDFDRHDRHEWRDRDDRHEWRGHGYGYGYGHVGVSVGPVVVPAPVVVAPPVYVPSPVVVAPPVVYAPAPVVYAPAPVCVPAPVIVAPPCGPRYYSTTTVGGYYSNGGVSIGFSIGR